MTSTHWGHETLPNLECWDELNGILAQWICRERGRKEVKPNNHIKIPAVDDHSCDWCFNEAVAIVNGDIRQLLQVYGSSAFACGLGRVPETEAARRALKATIERLQPKILRERH